MESNFLNMIEKHRDIRIYRVFSVSRLFEVFNENKLTLLSPSKWDDPFENFIMNATGELKDGSFFKVGFREHFFGQCWSFTRESDAIWRIYAPNKDGVRVTSTPRKLLSALYKQADNFRDLHCFIGEVQYYNKKTLTQLMLDSKKISSWILDITGVGQAQTLLFKRTAFKHENEVRLIYNSNGSCKDCFFKFQIDPYDLIEEIAFDPRMDYKIFKKYKESLIKLGFKKPIFKSKLYMVPKLSFKLDKKLLLTTGHTQLPG